MPRVFHRLGGIVARHRELALAVAFAATAAWELVEFLILENRHVASGPLTLLVHSVQVALVLAVTWVIGRAWQERLRHEAALARMGPFLPVDAAAMNAALGVNYAG